MHFKIKDIFEINNELTNNIRGTLLIYNYTIINLWITDKNNYFLLFPPKNSTLQFLYLVHKSYPA